MTKSSETGIPVSIGLMDDVDAIATQVSIRGSTLIDIGCGSGGPAQKLADRGATVTALDPDLRRDDTPYGPTEAGGKATFRVGSALELPLGDDTVDAALFIYSMHHIPADKMADALAEAARVVKPGGLVYIAEPMLEGSSEDVCRSFHDETEVRQTAQVALDRAEPNFASRQRFVYDVEYHYTDFEEYLQDFAHYDFPDSLLRSPTVVAAFDACRTDIGYVLDQPVLVDVFKVAG